jgi:AcrR family transcriptional regulator
MTSDKSDIREQIVSMASEIFNRFGFRKATMDEIARTLGKGKSSIYYYFESKEEIYEAVIDREASQLRKEIMKALAQSDDPKEKLRNYIVTRMRTFRKVSNFYEAIRTEMVSHLDFIENVRRKYDQDEIRLVSEILSDGVSRKIFRIDDPVATATAIVTAMKGLEIPLFLTGRRKNDEARMQPLLDILFYGIMR